MRSTPLCTRCLVAGWALAATLAAGGPAAGQDADNRRELETEHSAEIQHNAGDRNERNELTAIKWHPGHYMLVYLGETQALRLRRFDAIAEEPVIRGAQVRYRWAQLEPHKGVYDFSAIERDLARLQANGKRLVIQVMDRNFGKSDSGEGIVPSYLLSDPEYGGGVVKNVGGVVARLWDPAVMDREIALLEALGRRFDAEPFVEGVTSEETAMGLAKNPPADFSDAAVAEQFNRWIAAVRAAWPRSNVFLYTNFLGKRLDGLIAECARQRCGAGGPDVLPPPHNGTSGDRILRGASGGVDYRGRIPIAYSVQTPELGGKEGQFTPEQLFDHAYRELRANYIFWVRNTGTGGAAQKWDTGILPYLRSIDGKIHTECPRDWQNACAADASRAPP
jgi:hypothetical protein